MQVVMIPGTRWRWWCYRAAMLPDSKGTTMVLSDLKGAAVVLLD
jgi:hypothetical protein